MFRFAQVFETRRAREHSLDRTDAGFDGGCECILGGFVQPFAAGNTALQHLWIYEGLVYALSGRVELMTTFQFHRTRAFAA